MFKRKKKIKNRLRAKGVTPNHFDRSQIKILAYMVPICVVMMLPIIFVVMNAFKPVDELFAYPPRLYVKNPTLQNFVDLFSLTSQTNIPMSRYLFNSILYTVITVVSTIYIAACAGYVLSKKKFKTKRALFKINQMALMFVPVAVQIPRYFVMVYTGLTDNFLANILPHLAVPTSVFLVKQFMDQLPDSLIEAAVIDGAGDITIMRRIVMPLIKSPLATVAILSFSSAWNATEASSYYINNDSLKNFAFYVSTLSNATGNVVAGAGVSAAATLIMLVPSLILFAIMQSRVMNSMAHSGIK
jgi:ABC-type glycerol-3-phosphate transport system permease component